VNVVLLHNWEVSRRYIDAIDTAAQSVIRTGAGMQPWNPWRRNTSI
jgi:hypothetical protein